MSEPLQDRRVLESAPGGAEAPPTDQKDHASTAASKPALRRGTKRRAVTEKTAPESLDKSIRSEADEAAEAREPNPLGPRTLGGRRPREELSPQQLRGVAAVLTHPTIAAAAEEIGVHPRTMSRWFKEPGFLREYLAQVTELQLELWGEMLAVRSEVWSRFLELVRSDDDRIALRATTWFLDRMLSVPAIVGRMTVEEDGGAVGIPPRLRAFLADPDGFDDEDQSGLA
jgi:hypothetical protein